MNTAPGVDDRAVPRPRLDRVAVAGVVGAVHLLEQPLGPRELQREKGEAEAARYYSEAREKKAVYDQARELLLKRVSGKRPKPGEDAELVAEARRAAAIPRVRVPSRVCTASVYERTPTLRARSLIVFALAELA